MPGKNCTYSDCSKDVHGESEYCIFHKPDKNKEEAIEFYAKIRSKAKKPKGKRVKDDDNEYKKWVFEEKLFCVGYRFPKIPTVSEIDGKIFSFKHVNFYNRTGFDRAIFEHSADFSDSYFEKGAHFGAATFRHGATFAGSDFHKADFAEATFSEKTVFSNANFRGKARFFRIHSEGIMLFGGCDFRGEALFHDSYFRKQVDFSGATFHENSDAKFKGSIFKRVCKLKDATFKAGLDLAHSTFEQGAEIVESSEVTNGIELEDNLKKFYKLSTREALCRVQKVSFEQVGKKEEADKLFVHEMRARRKQKNDCWARVERWVADLTCEYGTNWRLVITRSLQTMGVFTILFWAFSIITLLFRECWPWLGVFKPPKVPLNEAINLNPLGILEGLGDSIYYSVVTFTTLGFGDLHPAGITMKTLSGIESILGALFVALIIAVFARKWMRS